MRKILLLSFLLVMVGVPLAMAQATLTGSVSSSQDAGPLPGVNVSVKGTTIGTVTDANGAFSLTVPEDATTLVFSFVGFIPQEVAIGNRTNFQVALREDIAQLSEVIVTGLGIERDKRSLGYATQEFKTDAVAQRSTPNVLTALQGKVAGVNIVGASGAPGSSTNINIRGITSFTGDNQPLFVIDGIPVSNNVDNTENTLFGSQPSNRAADINPENVESITILKGPAAAALYGSRASNGAIIITTKSGRGSVKKTEVTVNSSINFQDVIGLPRLQDVAGQGTQNNYVNNSTASWGPFFGTPGFDSVRTLALGPSRPSRLTPYQAQNHFDEFYQQGYILQNSVNMASGNENGSYFLSLGNTEQQGIIPNTRFGRTNAQFNGNTRLENGLQIGASIGYTRSDQLGIPGGNGGSAFGQMSRVPRSYSLLPFENELGENVYYSATQNNPIWSAQNEQLVSVVDRIIGSTTIGYDITSWMNVTYRLGVDTYTDRRTFQRAIGSARAPLGDIREETFYRAEINGDLLVTLRQNNLFVDGLNAEVLLGQNINQRTFRNSAVVGEQLTIPGFFNPNNASVFTNSLNTSTLRRIAGYYGQLRLDYRNFLFLEVTGRADQSSTLPVENNTFFYPSISASFAFSELLNLDPGIFSYGKIRGNIATVGTDADPYLLQTFFVQTAYGNNVANANFPLRGQPGFSLSSRIGSNLLTPSFTTAYEIGTNLGFLNNRIGVDFTYFRSESTDQILDVGIAGSTGFFTRTSNVGSIENRGVELLITGTPVRTNNFTWDVAVNYTRIRNKVLAITDDIVQFPIPGNRFGGIEPSVVLDQPYGVIVGFERQRAPDGQLLINPQTGGFAPAIAGRPIADPNPDWWGGINNTFTYKGLALSFLVDIRKGGQLYSFQIADHVGLGSLYLTGIDREEARILPGVIAVVSETGDTTGFRPNDIQISSETYWRALGGLASEEAVFDATVYRLRELSLMYNLPRRWLERSPFGDISVGVTGRNLYFFAPNFPMDPEVNTQGAGNSQGLDLNSAPNVRNYGFNLRFTL